MTSPQLDASVVICAHTEERWDALAAAVSSIALQTRPPGRRSWSSTTMPTFFGA
jgi:hypothetical protein